MVKARGSIQHERKPCPQALVVKKPAAQHSGFFAIESRRSARRPKGLNIMSLNDDQLRALGSVTVWFNDLEYMMHSIVATLVNSDRNIGGIVFEGESFDRMLDKLKRLNQYIHSSDYERRTWIERWAVGANDLKRRRNEVLHAQWVVDHPTGEMVTRRLFSRSLPKAPIRADELDQLATDIQIVVAEAIEILKSLFAKNLP
jgi:hypothetical protein